MITIFISTLVMKFVLFLTKKQEESDRITRLQGKETKNPVDPVILSNNFPFGSGLSRLGYY